MGLRVGWPFSGPISVTAVFGFKTAGVFVIKGFCSKGERILGRIFLGMAQRTANGEFGPNYLGYYKTLLCNLFSKGEDGKLLFVEADVEPQAEACHFRGKDEGNFSVRNNSSTKTCGPLISFFNRAVGEELSEYKKERLKAIIHESVVSLNHEANEILGEILAKFHSESNMHSIASADSYSSSLNDGMREHSPSKKRKSADCNNLGSTFGILNSQAIKQASNDIQGIQGDTLSCQEAIDKRTNKIFEKVSKLDEDVEELLNVVVSKCRPMTDAEKQQLGRRIQNLPAEALAHVAETFYPRCSQAGPAEIFCDLESLDNVTLWRLYYYTMCKRFWRLPSSKTV